MENESQDEQAKNYYIKLHQLIEKTLTARIVNGYVQTQTFETLKLNVAYQNYRLTLNKFRQICMFVPHQY